MHSVLVFKLNELSLVFIFRTFFHHHDKTKQSSVSKGNARGNNEKNKKCNVSWVAVFSSFYTPVWKDRGHIVLPVSVCPSVHLHKLNIFPLLLH